MGQAGGTVTWGQNDGQVKTIPFTVTNDTLVEFNEDFHVFLYRVVDGAPVLVGNVNECSVTILFDDKDAPAGSVDQLYNADYAVDMVPPVATVPPQSPQPGRGWHRLQFSHTGRRESHRWRQLPIL